MTPLIVLIYLPIFTIVLVIVAIIRLIIRVSSKSSSSQNTQYRPPQQNPGPYGQPNTGPYGQPNPNPNNPQFPPPVNPNPQPWQNPGTPQQPDYTQPNYNQPDYTKPNYTQPNYTQPNYTQPDYTQPNYQSGIPPTPPGTTKRSTNIPQGYATQIPEAPKSSKKTLIIVFSIIGVVAIAAGIFATIIFKRSGSNSTLVSADFELAYENPTDNSYLIILDDWDTIKVEPHSASVELDYTFKRDQTEFHWKMTTDDGTLIADTTVKAADLEAWKDQRYASGYYDQGMILLNPSRTQFVYYTAWFDQVGTEYMEDTKVGDSTFFADARVTTSAFIIDERDPQYVTALKDASPYSTSQQNQFLVNQYDFVVLYNKLNTEDDPYTIMEDYRTALTDLFEVSREEVLVNNAYDADDIVTLYDLDSLIPSEVDQYTEPRDFVDAIEFVKDHKSLFRATAREQYDYVVDSADVVLKHAYTEHDRDMQYAPMKYVTYAVRREGIFADEPRREMVYDTDRDESDANYY